MPEKSPEEIASVSISEANRSNAKHLDLSKLKLTDLPAELWQLTQLTSLNLSDNQLTSLPAEIGHVANLSSLDLSNNQLTSLPAEIGQLANLTSLNLSGNSLPSLSAEIGQLTHLTSLILSGNSLTSLPAEIGRLTLLTSLNLRVNQLTSLPTEIGQLTNLNALNLSGNLLANVPAALWQLTQLTALNLSKNQLTSLPAEIGQLTNLTSLNLRVNKLASLPPEISQLTNLVSLDLSNIQLTSLPAIIGQLTNLTSLNLSEIQLTSLPPEIGRLTRLTSLYLANNQLTSLPAEIGQLTHLTSLYLSNNQLTSLPAEIVQLTDLSWLALSSNALNSLPTEIGQLTNLISLYISRNNLTTLPTEIGHLANLTSLYLSSNQLTALPAEIGQLANLTSLDLSKNQLTSLPAEIGQLTHLTSLDLYDNQLACLPAEIGQLTNLTSLDLHNTSLTSLPAEIIKLKKLTSLNLKENLLDFPPEIINKTTEPQSLLDYFARILTGKRKPINETKILVVGQGSVGKSSLVKRILSAIFDPNETKTEGILINRWYVDNQSEETKQPSQIQLNIWDFGGQDIMHATHQFFLTKRSLYLLVLDARLTQEENRLEYWLKIIQSFGGEAPVIVVGNKIDQHPLDIDRTGLQKKYPNIAGILETSAATGVGIAQLKGAIAEQVNALPHVRDLLPESWFTVKNQLEGLGQAANFITHDKYLELCVENGVIDETSQRTLIGFLHDLGVVLHFQDEPRLEALGILNPQWVTNGVYRILNSHLLFQNKGVLTISMLDEILNLPEYPRGKRLFIVDMMRKFELCYDIEPEKTFLVPDLLPKDEPFTGKWDGALAFQYHYNVLPSSIMTRFIVRMNPYIHKTVWRSGVVLKKDGNTALIKADSEDRKIYIWVNGDEPTRRDFLSAIRAEFEAIHKTIPRIEARQKVPVPGQEKVVVDFEHLLLLERKGVQEYIPEGMAEVVSVRQLLNGVQPETGRPRGGNVIVGDENSVKLTAPAGKPPDPTTESVAPNPPLVQKKPLILRILTIIFLSLPKILGRTILDVFGRDKAADMTALLLGYGLIVLAVLIAWRIVEINSLVNTFKEVWRFFFPVK